MPKRQDQNRTEALARALTKKIERDIAESGRKMRFDATTGRYVLVRTLPDRSTSTGKLQGEGQLTAQIRKKNGSVNSLTRTD